MLAKPFSGDPGYLPFTWGKAEIPVGKSNG